MPNVLEIYNSSSFLYRAVTAPTFFLGMGVGFLFHAAAIPFGRRANMVKTLKEVKLNAATTFIVPVAAEHAGAAIIANGIAVPGLVAGVSALGSITGIWLAAGLFTEPATNFLAFRAGFRSTFGYKQNTLSPA